MSTHSDGRQSDGTRPDGRDDARGRNKERTKRKLIEATIALVREEGFERVGVNAIAERAGVSKVLIYRYFENLSGLFEAVADSIDPLQSTRFQELMAATGTTDVEGEADRFGSSGDPGAMMKQMVFELHRGLKGDELTKQLLIWELSNRNELTEALSAARERMGLELTERLTTLLREGGYEPKADLNAVLALVTGGVFYLTLRSDSVQDFNGVDIRSDGGWARIADAVSNVFRSLLMDRA
jgi:AcrR family transcriptional regulator